MSLLLANRALDVSIVGADVIKITMTPTASFTVGINLTFASGTLTIDWKDGSSTENFVSGVELTHQYVSAGTNIAEITGNLTEITSFEGQSSRITAIDLASINITALDLSGNLFSGAITLPKIQSILVLTNNPLLTAVNHAISGNLQTTIYRINNTGIIGNHDLSNQPIAGQLFAGGCSALTGFTFASSGNGILTDTELFSSGFTTIDLSAINISGKLWANLNASATSLILATSGNGLLNDVRLYSSGYTSFDFSNTPCGGSWWVNGCSSLGSMDFSNAGNTALTNWLFNNCNQTNFDFSVFPTSNGINMDLRNNSFTATEHDNQLINLDAQGWINGILPIIAGNTARTAASDTAYNNLISNGWVIT